MYFFPTEIKNVLDKQELFYETISEVVNSYCIDNTAICCASLGQQTRHSTKYEITSTSDVYFASGYPHEVAGIYKTRTIVTTTKLDLAELCDVSLSDPWKNRGDIYVDPTILLNAVSEGRIYIENKMEVLISYIESPVSMAKR